MNIWDKLGVKPADILLPANCDTEKWSCIACDQFTSDKEYWDEMDRFVGDAPSTLRITFPEIYLGHDDESYIAGINSRMRQYLPMGWAAKTPPFDRTVTDTEYDAVLSWMYLLDLDNGFTQEAAASDQAYIPPFDFEGL